MVGPPFRDNQAPRHMSLSVGDIAPGCVLPDRHGSVVDLRSDAIAGNVIAIVFCPGYTAAVAQVLSDYRSRLKEMGPGGIRFFGVTRARPEVPAGRDIPFPVLSDIDGEVFQHSMRTHVITRLRSSCDRTTMSPLSSNPDQRYMPLMHLPLCSVWRQSASRYRWHCCTRRCLWCRRC